MVNFRISTPIADLHASQNIVYIIFWWGTRHILNEEPIIPHLFLLATSKVKKRLCDPLLNIYCFLFGYWIKVTPHIPTRTKYVCLKYPLFLLWPWFQLPGAANVFNLEVIKHKRSPLKHFFSLENSTELLCLFLESQASPIYPPRSYESNHFFPFQTSVTESKSAAKTSPILNYL